jgi:hypothetical protein
VKQPAGLPVADRGFTGVAPEDGTGAYFTETKQIYPVKLTKSPAERISQGAKMRPFLSVSAVNSKAC